MAYLAPARTTQRLYITDAEGRKIVVKHESLEGFAFKRIQTLPVIRRPESGSDQRLRFAAGK